MTGASGAITGTIWSTGTSAQRMAPRSALHIACRTPEPLEAVLAGIHRRRLQALGAPADVVDVGDGPEREDHDEEGDEEDVVEEAAARDEDVRGRVDERPQRVDREAGDGERDEQPVVAVRQEHDPEGEEQDLRECEEDGGALVPVPHRCRLAVPKAEDHLDQDTEGEGPLQDSPKDLTGRVIEPDFVGAVLQRLDDDEVVDDVEVAGPEERQPRQAVNGWRLPMILMPYTRISNGQTLPRLVTGGDALLSDT